MVVNKITREATQYVVAVEENDLNDNKSKADLIYEAFIDGTKWMYENLDESDWIKLINRKPEINETVMIKIQGMRGTSSVHFGYLYHKSPEKLWWQFINHPRIITKELQLTDEWKPLKIK